MCEDSIVKKPIGAHAITSIGTIYTAKIGETATSFAHNDRQGSHIPESKTRLKRTINCSLCHK
jgi:hypothetical protein